MFTSRTKCSRRAFLRQIGLTAGFVAGATALHACALPPARAPQPTPASQQPVAEPTVTSYASAKLTLITSADQKAFWEYLNEQFKRDHPEVEFELIAPGYDQMRTKIVSTLAAGADLDVYSLDIVWVGEFANAGFALPLDDTLTQQEKDGFLPGLIEGLSSNGKLMAMPGGAWFKNLFFNTDIVEQLGLDAPPRTYEELITVGKQAQADGVVKFPMGWGWAQAEGLICDWTMIHHAFGGKWFEGGAWVVNDEPGIAALTYMVENLAAQVFDPASITFNDRTVMNPFFASDYMAMTNWGLFGWNTSNDPKESKIVGKVDVGLLYGTKAAGVESASCSGMSGVAVGSKSKNKDLAIEWVRRLAGVGHPENTRQAMTLAGIPPVQAWAWNDPDLVKEIPALPKIAAQSKYLVHRPSASLVKYNDWSQMAQVELTKALTGQRSPKDTLNTIAEISNRDFKPI
ncbi:MAG: extracellular solute-binding protein [Anaerolineae bacterium]|nr:extracellular solute-binding protein [Candidatus Roseilinea sp.]MDW8450076.1 extracellular solute-binding protein [Anaerolineae bacterium]